MENLESKLFEKLILKKIICSINKNVWFYEYDLQDVFECSLKIWTSSQEVSLLLTRCFLQGKQVIRPIAFRPVPGGGSGASTPTNSHFGSFRPVGAPSSGHTTPSQPTYIDQPSPAPPPAGGGLQLIGSTTVTHPTNPALPKANEGFAPGHPLVKDGRRHYGSKYY